MLEAFVALVQLTRLAERKVLNGHVLELQLANTVGLDDLLDQVTEFRAPDVVVAGNPHYGKVNALALGTPLVIRVAGLTSSTNVFTANLASFLAFQGGAFARRTPEAYYLLEENYLSGEAVQQDSNIERYQRVPHLLSFLKRVADVAVDDEASLVFLSGARLDVAIEYSVNDLAYMPTAAAVDEVQLEIFSPPFESTKRGMIKNVFARFLRTVPVEQRFGQLVRVWKAAIEAYRADFELYQTEFNFEKVRESFEQKKLDYLLKLNAATADSLTKLLAIPVAQGLLVSQLKSDASSALANSAVALGALIFAGIALLILLSHRHSIKQIAEELRLDRSAMSERFPLQYQRVKATYDTVAGKVSVAASYPWVLGAVLLIATAFTIYAFVKVPPFGPALPVTTQVASPS